jgi:REP element-mobilizing transposase RayT
MEIEPLEPDFFYHVYNRGINRQPIFSSDHDYLKFLGLCQFYIPQMADIYSYCLLPNHFHLLLYIHPDGVGTPRRGVNSPLCNLFNSYAQWFNKKTSRTGGLFQRPFKRKRITDQDYLKQVIYYIHRNPIHHHLSETFSLYPYSSYPIILGNQSTCLQREQVLDWFDGRENFIHFHHTMGSDHQIETAWEDYPDGVGTPRRGVGNT